MNTNMSSSVETEEVKGKTDEAQTASRVWMPSFDPDVNREDTQTHPSKETGAATPQEVIPQFSSGLSFTCLLIPRFSDHYLVGDIVNDLLVWMKQACISYGWRLDSISIRPGYMQWVMQVPLNANPAHFLRLIRKHTSEKIFEDFPRFRQKNVSGEFWAPGHFVVPGNQLQTPEQVNEYILQTRRYQGI